MKVVPVLPEQNADLDFAKQFSRWQYFQSSAYICENAETQKSGKIKNMKGLLDVWTCLLTRFGFCKIIFKANAETQTETGGKTKKMKVVLLLPAEYLRKFVKTQRQNADLGFAKWFSRWQRSSPAFIRFDRRIFRSLALTVLVFPGWIRVQILTDLQKFFK